MKQLLKQYNTPTDVFVFGITDVKELEESIFLTDDYETLWIQFPDRIERFYIDTSGDFSILTRDQLSLIDEYSEGDLLVLEGFFGKLSIDVIGDVTETSLLKENFDKKEYLFEQLDEYNDTDNPEYVLYVEGDYNDVYTTTLEKYLKHEMD